MATAMVTATSRNGKVYSYKKPVWTQEMRDAQAARIRKLHRKGTIKAALRRSHTQGKLERIANRNRPFVEGIPASQVKSKIVGGKVQAHPDKLRRRVLKLLGKGVGAAEVARRLGMKLNTVYTWKYKFRDKGAENENGNHSTAVIRTSPEHNAEVVQSSNAPGEVSQFEREHTISAVGECRGFLKEYAIRFHLPVQDFTRRVGQILRSA